MSGLGRFRIGIVAAMLGAASIAMTGCTYERHSIAPSSEAELVEFNKEVRDLRWESMGLPTVLRPRVEFEGYIDPERASEVYDACLEEAGYSEWRQITSNSFGGISEAEMIATYVCESRFPVEPTGAVISSTSRVDVLYSYYRDSLVPCLVGAGLDVGGVPTRANFALSVSFGRLWTPYGHDVGINDAESMAIRASCGDLTSAILES